MQISKITLDAPKTETEVLRERIIELEQLIADLASLQLEVMMNG
jgi:hypothetical protein